MSLTIQAYEQAELLAVQRLPNRIVESFGPYHFTKVGYPTRISAESEIYKFADAMHEGELEEHLSSLGGLTQDEWDLVRQTTEQVWKFSSRDDYPVLPRAALLRCIHTLRHLRALFGEQRPRILELGPGSGYLGALLVGQGYPYAAMDNAEGFYLYQHRLWNEVSHDQVVELADPALDLDAAFGQLSPRSPIHIPWWRYVNFRPDTAYRFDVVICSRVLCEMHPTSRDVNLRLARAFLGGSQQSHKLLFFDGWGADIVSTPAMVTAAILKAGFTPASDEQGITLFTPADLRPPFDPAKLETAIQALQQANRASEMDLIHDLFLSAQPNVVSDSLTTIGHQPQTPKDIGLDSIVGFYEMLTGRVDHRNPDEIFGDDATFPYFLGDLIPTDRPLAIFGAGRHGKYVTRGLRRFGRSVSFLSDNDSQKWGQTLDGLQVLGPLQIPAGTFIVIASSWAQEIQAQLLDQGLLQGQDFLVWPTWL